MDLHPLKSWAQSFSLFLAIPFADPCHGSGTISDTFQRSTIQFIQCTHEPGWIWSGPPTHFHTCLCQWEITENTATDDIETAGNTDFWQRPGWTRRNSRSAICLLARSHGSHGCHGSHHRQPVLRRSFQRIWGQSLHWHSSQQSRPHPKNKRLTRAHHMDKNLMVVAVCWAHNRIATLLFLRLEVQSIYCAVEIQIWVVKPVKKPDLNESECCQVRFITSSTRSWVLADVLRSEIPAPLPKYLAATTADQDPTRCLRLIRDRHTTTVCLGFIPLNT